MQDYYTTLELYYIVIIFLSKVIGFFCFQQKLLVLFYASATEIIIIRVL